MPDWGWWALGAAIMALTLGWDAWRRERIYRQIRRDTAYLSESRCPGCRHPEHPMICIADRCGCDLMTDPE